MSTQIARALYSASRPHTRPIDAPYDPPVPITYGREFFGEELSSFGLRADVLIEMGVSESVLVVGTGFGFLMETLMERGVSDVWGVEPGDFYFEHPEEWNSSIRERVARDWIGSKTVRGSLNNLGVPGAAKFSYVIDEDAAPAHTDQELSDFFSGLEQHLKGRDVSRIIHLVTANTSGDSSQNWKPFEEWQGLAPNHTWINLRSL